LCILTDSELEQLAAALTTAVVVLTSTGELMAHGIPYSTVLLDVGSGAAAVAQQQQQQQQPQLPARSCTIEHTLSLPDYVQVPQGGSLSGTYIHKLYGVYNLSHVDRARDYVELY
jgi:hypothetical protein